MYGSFHNIGKLPERLFSLHLLTPLSVSLSPPSYLFNIVREKGEETSIHLYSFLTVHYNIFHRLISAACLSDQDGDVGSISRSFE